MKSLRSKLIRTSVATLGLVCLLVLAVAGALQLQAARRHLATTHAEIERALDSKGRLLVSAQAVALARPVAAGGVDEVRRLVGRTVLSDQDIVYGTFVDRSGQTWAYADATSAGADPAANAGWRELPQAPAGRSKNEQRRFFWRDEEVSEFAADVESDGARAGSVRYGLSLAAVSRANERAHREAGAALAATLAAIGGIGLLALVAGVAVTRRLASHITRPLHELTLAARKVSEGATTVPVDVRSGDELEALAVSFNKMVRDLGASHAELQAANHQLEERVKERTALLRAKTSDLQALLGALRQGLFTVLPGQRVHHEHSKQLEVILETDEIAGRPLLPLLFKNGSLGFDAQETLSAALDNCLGTESLNFLLNSHLLPKEFEIAVPSGRKTVEAEWSAVESADGFTTALIVTLRDVTELRDLQREAEAQRRALATLGQLLAVPEGMFQEFLRSIDELLARCRALLTGPDVDPQALDELFGRLHTAKGNARTLGFTEVSEIIHRAEDEIVARRGRPLSAEDVAALGAWLEKIDDTVASHRLLMATRLPQEGQAADPAAPDAELIAALEGMSARLLAGAPAAELGRELGALLRRLRARPLVELLASSLGGLAELASAAGKPRPELELRGGELLVDGAIAPLLRDLLGHLLRNALAHGIEAPDERAAKGKPALGRIVVEAALHDDALELLFGDDGTGLDLPRLRARGEATGLLAPGAPASDEEVAALVFAPGLSTAVQASAIAGRGVGLDAVRRFVEERGGEVTLELGAGRHEGRPFALRLRLPFDKPALPLAVPPSAAPRRAGPAERVRASKGRGQAGTRAPVGDAEP